MPQYTLEQLGNQVLSELDAWGRQDILVGGITSVATSFTGKDKSNYKRYTKIEIGTEIAIIATEATSNNVNITDGRGREGSTNVAHNAGDIIRIRPRVYREHINMLINDCLTGYLEIRAEDESLTTILNQQVYDIPAGISLNQVTAIEIMDADGTNVEGPWKRVKFHSGTGTGGLDEFELRGNSISGRTIKLSYRTNFTALSSLSDILDETGYPDTDSAQKLPVLFALSHLLPRKEGKRMMKDKNTFPDGATPFGARHRDGDYYWDKFIDQRNRARLSPNKSGTQFIGW